MYKLLLILRYLRRKLAPIFALLAVALCTAMVIIVISIMGGFLEMMRDATRRLSSDITIVGDLTGLPEYEELIKLLVADEHLSSATPVMHGFGLINLQGDVLTSEVMGIKPTEFDKVTQFKKSLMWSADDYTKSDDERYPLNEKRSADDQKIVDTIRKTHRKYDLVQWGMNMEVPEIWTQSLQQREKAYEKNRLQSADTPLSTIKNMGAVPGIHVSRRSYRDAKGQYHILDSSVSSKLTLTVVPVTTGGTLLEPSVRELVVVNEFKSGLYDIDANRVFVPFEVLQKMMRMDPSQEVDPETGKPTGKMNSGRTSFIMVRGKAGLPLEEVRSAVIGTVRDFMLNHPGFPPPRVLTWKERHATFLGAVEKEKGLLTFLFGFISLVAVVMIAVIFYMIVLEKTRDIGTLRAIGASKTGIAAIFMGYGLAIGILGAAAGFGIAAGIVWNINAIQDFLGTQLGVTALYAGVAASVIVLLGLVGGIIALVRGSVGGWFAWALPAAVLAGLTIVFVVLHAKPDIAVNLNSQLRFVMWDPQIYYFDKVPSRMNPTEVTVILIFAVLSSLLGSLVPALLAARLNPVESLRYE